MPGFLGFLHVNPIIMAINVWRLPMCRSAQNDGWLRCPDHNPTPDLTVTLTLTLTPTHPLGGSRFALEIGRGSISLRANLKTLHVRAIKLLVSEQSETASIKYYNNNR